MFVGTVVKFLGRQADPAAKAEAILAKIGELYRRRTRAKEELPRVLAELASTGETELVVRAVRLWGSGEMEPDEVLDLCLSHARKKPVSKAPKGCKGSLN